MDILPPRTPDTLEMLRHWVRIGLMTVAQKLGHLAIAEMARNGTDQEMTNLLFALDGDMFDTDRYLQSRGNYIRAVEAEIRKGFRDEEDGEFLPYLIEYGESLRDPLMREILEHAAVAFPVEGDKTPSLSEEAFQDFAYDVSQL